MTIHFQTPPPAALPIERPVALAELFQLLGDKTRLSILMRLADGEWNVSALCRDLNLPQPTVSHHLSLLRINGLVVNRRDGKQVYYSLPGHDSPAGPVLTFRAGGLTVRVSDDAATPQPTARQADAVQAPN